MGSQFDCLCTVSCLTKFYKILHGNLRWPTTVTAKYNSSRQNKICHGKIKFITAKYNLSRQNTIHHGKIQFVTAKYNSSRQNTIYHGKKQFETTNSNYSRQTTNTHGKSKNNNCNSKFFKARAKRSRQKQIKNGGQRLMVSGCPSISTWCSDSQ